jgi:hypothetical protein
LAREANQIARRAARASHNSYRVSFLALLFSTLISGASAYFAYQQVELAKIQISASLAQAQTANEANLSVTANEVFLDPPMIDEDGLFSYWLINRNAQPISNVWYEYADGNTSSDTGVRIGLLGGCQRVKLIGPRDRDVDDFRVTVIHYTDPIGARWKRKLGEQPVRDDNSYTVEDRYEQLGPRSEVPGCGGSN